MGDLVGEIFQELGIPTRTNTQPELELSATAAVVAIADAQTAQQSEIPPAAVAAQPPPPRVATATELFTWIKRVLLAQTHLSDDGAELVAFWVISTWYPDALTVLPCLVISGPAHDANRVLHVLKDFCLQTALMAGFGRSHLDVVRRYWTNLISEPNLDKRTANLLSSLTDREFSVVAGSSFACYSKSTAIYAGENPETHKILNSVHIHLTPTNPEPTTFPHRLKKTIDRVPTHLSQYRERNLAKIQHAIWTPSGLSSEMATMAAELGRCIVDAPELRQKLLTLLKIQDKQHLSDLSNTTEAIVLEATLNLCHQGKSEFLAGEIATEVNRIQKARSEPLTYSAEKIGHVLKKVGLHTRRSSAGMRLVMDRVTIAEVHKTAAVYGIVGLEEEDNNLHCQYCDDNKQLM